MIRYRIVKILKMSFSIKEFNIYTKKIYQARLRGKKEDESNYTTEISMFILFA